MVISSEAWGSVGSGNGQFSTPIGLAVDSSGKYMWLIWEITGSKSLETLVILLKTGTTSISGDDPHLSGRLDLL